MIALQMTLFFFALIQQEWCDLSFNPKAKYRTGVSLFICHSRSQKSHGKGLNTPQISAEYTEAQFQNILNQSTQKSLIIPK